MEITCQQVRTELSNYIDDDVTPTLRTRIELHVTGCPGCRALYDSVRGVIRLVSDVEVIELPAGFSRRLKARLERSLMN